jgi:hypothetical protein
VLAEEAYAITALRMPWGNCGSGTTPSTAGAVATSPMVASRCVVTRAARRRLLMVNFRQPSYELTFNVGVDLLF